jgi:hypothetical protein
MRRIPKKGLAETHYGKRQILWLAEVNIVWPSLQVELFKVTLNHFLTKSRHGQAED